MRLYIFLLLLMTSVVGLVADDEYGFIDFFVTAKKIQENIAKSDDIEKQKLLAKIPSELNVPHEKLLLLEATIDKDRSDIKRDLDAANRSKNTVLILLEDLKLARLNVKVIASDWLRQFSTLKQGRYNQETLTDLLNAIEASLQSIQFESYEVQIMDLPEARKAVATNELNTLKLEIQTYQEILAYLRANSALLLEGYLMHTLAVNSVIAWIDEFYPIHFWRFSFGKLVICILILLIFYSLRKSLAKLIVKSIKVIFRHHNINKTQNTIISALIRPLSWFLFFYGFDLCLTVIYYPESYLEWMGRFFDVVYIINAAWFTMILLECYGATFLIQVSAHSNKHFRSEVINLLLKFMYFIVSCIALLTILARLDFNISAIIASLGIGGLAVALAAKDILANFFASIMLLFDNAFSQGDWIACDDIEGTVVEIGLRRTSIRTFDNALLFVPNSLLVGGAIYNWNRRKVGRRIKMNLGLTYAATADQIDQCIKDIKEMLQEHVGIAKKSHYNSADVILSLKQGILSIDDMEGNKSTISVYLDNFGDSSIDIVVSCFTVAITQLEWSQTKQDIMFKIMRIIEKNGLNFAFPSQSVYIENFPIDLLEKTLHQKS